MAARRTNPGVIKLHRSYSVSELAACFDVHKNTVRNWQSDGLEPVDASRPVLFHGVTIRAFLTKQNASRKRPCPPGTLYCFKCRAPRAPALGMADFIASDTATGNIKAICATCDTMMHRKARRSDLAMILPNCDVQIREAPLRLKGSPSPSLYCDLERAKA